MQKRRLYLPLIGVGLVVALFVALGFHSREPESGGRTLSQWVERYSLDSYSYPPYQDSARAIRDIGTNALPYLLDWVAYETPTWKIKLYGAVNPLLRHVKPSWQLSDDKQVRRANGAIEALIHLGSKAEGGIRVLSEKANGPATVESRVRALSILSRLGSGAGSALPAVVNLLNDPDPAVRAAAFRFVSQTNPHALEEARAKGE